MPPIKWAHEFDGAARAINISSLRDSKHDITRERFTNVSFYSFAPNSSNIFSASSSARS